MFLIPLLRYALFLLVPLSLVFTSILYLYPIFNSCAFPNPLGHNASASAFLNTFREHTSSQAYNASLKAPFRLLALGDPQLEGDTSIPDPDAASFPNLKKFWQDALLLDGVNHNLLQRIRHSLHDLVDFYLDDIPKTLESYRKRLDLLGNDYYLAHIYRTLYWWTKPTHVTVLGDLVGSQWIEDDEFNIRGWRYWNRVFKYGQRVSDELTAEREEWNGVPYVSVPDWSIPYLGDNAEEWKRRIINVAGNHDIGYAGDLTPERFERFERVFGRANYELRFQLPPDSLLHNTTSDEPSFTSDDREIPELRLVVLNDMNLDMPALSQPLQDATYTFLNHIITTSHPVIRPALFTLVLTHIPLYKDEGICVDGPFFEFHDSEEFAYGVKEQNHLSLAASKGLLEGIFGKNGDTAADGRGMGRNGLVLTGHDHEGCDVYHYINQSSPTLSREWEARRWKDAETDGIVDQEGVPGLREITVRSMMGEFGGNAGLLSLWFDEERWEWRFEYDTCTLGVQHWWWVVHILDLVTLIVIIIFSALLAAQKLSLSFLSESKSGSHTFTDARRKGMNGTSGTAMGSRPGTSDGSDQGSVSKRSLRKKRSKRGLNGTSEPEPPRRPLSAVFELQNRSSP